MLGNSCGVVVCSRREGLSLFLPPSLPPSSLPLSLALSLTHTHVQLSQELERSDERSVNTTRHTMIHTRSDETQQEASHMRTQAQADGSWSPYSAASDASSRPPSPKHARVR
jgi:hypothetical protein